MKSIAEVGKEYEKLYHSKSDTLNPMNKLRELFLADSRIMWGAKLNAHGDQNTYKTILDTAGVTKRNFIASGFAAEVFPDRTPPEIIVSDNETDTHEELRKKHPSQDIRISGMVIVDISNFSYFMLDSISLSNDITKVPTKASYTQVANLLLQNGYIPVDSGFEIIPISSIPS